MTTGTNKSSRKKANHFEALGEAVKNPRPLASLIIIALQWILRTNNQMKSLNLKIHSKNFRIKQMLVSVTSKTPFVRSQILSHYYTNPSSDHTSTDKMDEKTDG